MPGETHKPLNVNKEATEASGAAREVVVIEGEGEIEDIGEIEHHPGDASEGRDAAERVK